MVGAGKIKRRMPTSKQNQLRLLREQAETRKLKNARKRMRKRERKENMAEALTRGRIQGSGDYSYSTPGPFGKAGRAIGKALGGVAATAAGAPELAPLASFLGEKVGGLGHYIGRVLGSGDYELGNTPAQNSLLSLTNKTFDGFGTSEGTRIFNVEAFGTMDGSEDPFTIHHSLAINPANPALFPWLSDIALSYQQYRINGMAFLFVSESPDAIAAVGSLGYVGWCVEYDPYASDPTSKSDLLNRFWSGMTKPSKSYLTFLEAADSTRPTDVSYVWEESTGPTGPASAYDAGRMICAGGGQPSGTTELGQMFVIYDITLMKPRLPRPPTNDYMSFEWLVVTDAAIPDAIVPLPAPGLETVLAQAPSSGIKIVNDHLLYLPTSASKDRYFFIRLAAGRIDGTDTGCYWLPSGSLDDYLTPSFAMPTADGAGPGGTTNSAWSLCKDGHATTYPYTMFIVRVPQDSTTTTFSVPFDSAQIPDLGVYAVCQIWEVYDPGVLTIPAFSQVRTPIPGRSSEVPKANTPDRVNDSGPSRDYVVIEGKQYKPM